MTNKIVLLDESTINKIAAGEVIERPYSVVKELVENSIDANASEIIIKLKDGGKKQISVIDNGEGMSREDLLLCVKKHATSKIKVIEDIFNINSYGFRGEALATVAEVSKTEIITATNDSNVAHKLVIEEGKIKAITEDTKRKGTTINVYNLFYNVPARQKFLKTTGYELKRIVDWIKTIAISNPSILFKVYNENEPILDLRKRENYGERIKEVYGFDLLKSDYSDPVVSCICYFSKPSEVKDLATAKQQFYVNNRPIKNETVSKAIYKAFESKIPRGKKANCFVFLKIDSKVIDINVHPQKLEIRAKNDNIFYFPVYEAIRKKLESGIFDSNNEVTENQIKTKIISLLGQKQQESSTLSENAITGDSDSNIDTPYMKTNLQNIIEERKVAPKKEDNTKIFAPSILHPDLQTEFQKASNEQRTKKYRIIGQLLDTYILIETIGGSLLIIDQHVAEERYYYEKFYEEYIKNKQIKAQSLLVPISFEFDPEDVELIKEKQEALKQFGLDVDIFGKDSILLRQIPLSINTLPSKDDLKQMILDIVNEQTTFGTIEQKLDHVVATMACKTSIKAETPLTEHAMSKILEKLFTTKNPYTCPHGRPIIIELTKSEIEKKIGRKN